MKKATILLAGIVSATAANATTLTFHNVISGKFQNLQVNLGGTNSNVAAGAMSVSIDGGAKFTAFCVDLLHWNSNGSSYAINVKPMSDSGPNGNRAAWLFNNYAAGVNTTQKGAALQLALWDVSHDGGDGLSNGWFKSSVSGSLLTEANNLISASVGQSGSAYWLEAVSHGNDGKRNQNLMAAVPEPSSIAALLIGGAAILRRRKRA